MHHDFCVIGMRMLILMQSFCTFQWFISINLFVININLLIIPVCSSGKPLYPGSTEIEQLTLISEGVCTSNSVFSNEDLMIELTRDPSYTEKPIHPLSDRLPAKTYQSG